MTRPAPAHEPPLSAEVARRTSGLRTGWTTGTCASAAAKAAAVGLVTGQPPTTVEVQLPGGRRVRFPVEIEAANRCAVVKDAGDDPDCTDGARMTAEVVWATGGDSGSAGSAGRRGPRGGDAPGGLTVELRAGQGVGTVTLPGLGIDIGAPSVTSVPRRMIETALGEALHDHLLPEAARAVSVTLSVPGGMEMARKTTNERLGIVGGISVLGTTGIVRPFSTAAYRASVVQQVDVAAAQGWRHVALCTGSRSEAAATVLYPELPPVCVVEVGDFSGIALRRAAGAGMQRVSVVAMVGKIAKLAAGVMMTHFHRSEVPNDVLLQVAVSTGAPAAVVEAATATATARHFFDACVSSSCLAPLVALCQLARASCEAHAGGMLRVDVVLVDFEGAGAVARA
ncbi:MAG: cobalt-precorrin-5B (C(1))-methyltransferase CbiD [Acidimicrobiales bacterium]